MRGKGTKGEADCRKTFAGTSKKRIKFLQRSACHTKTPDGIFPKVTFLKSAIFPESLHRRK